MDKRVLPVAIVGVVIVGALLLLVSRRTPLDDSPRALAPSNRGASSLPKATPPLTASSSFSALSSVKSTSVASTTALARFAWGGGAGELGRSTPKEANPEGPMAVVAGTSGYGILDQVNGRLVRFDREGRSLPAFSVSLRAPQDFALTKEGGAVVLDRLADKTIAILGPEGKVLGTLPLEGKNITETGGITGVFVDGDDVYVEREHGQLVKVGDTKGKPSEGREEIPGRPTRDGLGYVSAWLEKGSGSLKSAYLSYSKKGASGEVAAHVFTRKVLTLPIASLVLLDSDRRGIVYLGVMVEEPETGEHNIVISCFSPGKGTLLGATKTAASTLPDETYREFTVLDEGGLLYLKRDATGAELVKLDCRSS